MVAYSGDFWPKLQVWKLAGDVERYGAACVAWPSDEAEIRKIVKLCREHAVPIVPYGAGSGVCGGTVPIRGGVIIDVKRMNKVISMDAESRIVEVQTGDELREDDIERFEDLYRRG